MTNEPGLRDINEQVDIINAAIQEGMEISPAFLDILAPEQPYSVREVPALKSLKIEDVYDWKVELYRCITAFHLAARVLTEVLEIHRYNGRPLHELPQSVSTRALVGPAMSVLVRELGRLRDCTTMFTGDGAVKAVEPSFRARPVSLTDILRDPYAKAADEIEARRSTAGDTL